MKTGNYSYLAFTYLRFFRFPLTKPCVDAEILSLLPRAGSSANPRVSLITEADDVIYPLFTEKYQISSGVFSNEDLQCSSQ